jgi:hypothetical protein
LIEYHFSPARNINQQQGCMEENMKYLMITLVVSLLHVATACAQGTEQIEEAQNSAIQWLALIDTGQHPESWDHAAELFRSSISKSEWEKTIISVRDIFGAVKQRKLKASTYTKTLPGAPDGEYVVLQFDTRFENKTQAIETVTPMREKDGSWKVSGYYIK